MEGPKIKMGVVLDDFISNLAYYKELRQKFSESMIKSMNLFEYIQYDQSIRDLINKEYTKKIRKVILEDVTKRLNINAEQAMIEIEELDLRLLE